MYVFETSILYALDQDETIGPRNAIGTAHVCETSVHVGACDIDICSCSTITMFCTILAVIQ